MRTLTLTLPEDKMRQVLDALRSNRTLVQQWADLNKDTAKAAEYQEQLMVAKELVILVSEVYFEMELMKYGLKYG